MDSSNLGYSQPAPHPVEAAAASLHLIPLPPGLLRSIASMASGHTSCCRLGPPDHHRQVVNSTAGSSQALRCKLSVQEFVTQHVSSSPGNAMTFGDSPAQVV